MSYEIDLRIDNKKKNSKINITKCNNIIMRSLWESCGWFMIVKMKNINYHHLEQNI